jgi:uncharacterized membrane protein YcaP (DUF421 family)
MQPFEIHWNDWGRILSGNVPLSFYVEILIRVTFIYLLILFCIRLMGKRMAGQLTRNEMAAISALAASIGVPVQTPERGLLPAVLVAMIVVLAQRVVSHRASHKQTFERKSQGKIDILVHNGYLSWNTLFKTRISRERLFAQLRTEGIVQLGEIERLYFEANGDFTLIRKAEPAPGLCILPPEDEAFIKEQSPSPLLVCSNCGWHNGTTTGSCSNCGHTAFTHAVNTVKKNGQA